MTPQKAIDRIDLLIGNEKLFIKISAYGSKIKVRFFLDCESANIHITIKVASFIVKID